MVYLTEMHKVTILQMIGYGDNIRTQSEVAGLFHEKFPDSPPISQGAISKIEKQFRELGHVRTIIKAAANTINDETKLDIMLEFEENPHSSSRKAAPPWTYKHRWTQHAYTFIAHCFEGLEFVGSRVEEPHCSMLAIHQFFEH